MKITPDIVLAAYAQGLFPMAKSRHAKTLHWFDPDFRGIFDFAHFHVPRRLAKTLKKAPYKITFSRDFPAVIRACADARPDTWINDEIIALYTELHRKGFAASAEAWDRDGKLAGGVYGVMLGRAFFGESMFSAKTDASKAAFCHLMARLWRAGYELVDAQFVNRHLVQFGILEVPRGDYRARLDKALGYSAESSKDDGMSSMRGAGAGARGVSAGMDDGMPDGMSAAAGGASSSTASTASASAFSTSGAFEGAFALLPSFGASSGASSGAVSDENVSDFAEVEAFLHSITQTS